MVDIALVFSSLILSWKESFIVTNKFPIPEKNYSYEPQMNRSERPVTSLKHWPVCITFTFMHLADAFVQSDLQCIQAIHLLSVCVPTKQVNSLVEYGTGKARLMGSVEP